ncbi:hypothetical protein BT93_K2053 [Corymbia citriodora subsp. variegata]|nr:hypothetical protein BT93_K2053 [Corymbia citriodora subsp. variegata]
MTPEKRPEVDQVTLTELKDDAPSHFVLKIKSFSLLKENGMEKYESGEFDGGGYKWKLIIYPNRDKSPNGEEYISVYLAACWTCPLQHGREIQAFVRFSVYKQTCDKYFAEQGEVTRFHALKTERGVPRFMPLKTFTDPSKGYLVDDTCFFGAEVFVHKSSAVGQCLTLKKSASWTHVWKITRLSCLGNGFSDVFTVGDHKWKVKLYPRGVAAHKGQSLSVFLFLDDADKLACGQVVNTRFTIRLKHRDNVVPLQQPECTVWFSGHDTNWGWPDFMPLKTVSDCLTDDACVIEAEVKVLGTVSKLP